MLRKIKSVAEQDRGMDISLQVNIGQDHEVVGCVICEKNLVDSILVPCRHVFCKLCIRGSMHEGRTIRCAACRKVATSAISFAAPIEIPFVATATVEAEADTDDSTKILAAEKIDVTASLWQDSPSSSTKGQGRSKSPLPRGGSMKATVSPQYSQTPMQLAASLGQTDVVAQLIENGADVNATPVGIDGKTALQAASEQGHLKIVMQLLAAGADPNGPVSPVGGRSALEVVAGNNHLAIVAHLLSHGALPLSAPYRKPALQAVAESGNEAVAALLLAYGYEPDVAVGLTGGQMISSNLTWRKLTRYDVRPSHLTAANGHLGVLKLLRKHGVNGMAADTYCASAACANGYLQVVSWVLDCEEEFEATQTTDEIKLTGELSILGLAGSRNSVDPRGFPFLQVTERLRDELVYTAVEHGQLEILKTLLRRGACLPIPASHSTKTNDHKRSSHKVPASLLHKAAESGSTEVVGFLLAAGFHVDNPRDGRERTPLMEAARAGKVQVFRCLVEHGADIWAQDYEGRSIMEQAAEDGSVEITSMLIDIGVQPRVTSTELTSPLSIFLKHRHELLTNFLLDKLATTSQDLSHCYTGALRAAAIKGEVNIVKELLRRGADPNLDQPRGCSTALDYRGTMISTATEEADVIDCAQSIFAAGGELLDVRRVFYRLITGRVQKPALTIFFLENCLDDSNTSGVDWSEALLAAIADCQPAVLRLIVSRIYLDGYAEQHSEIFREAVAIAAGLGRFDAVNILLQASHPEDAIDYARAAISILGLRREDHMRQYLEEGFVLELNTTGECGPAPT